RTFLGLPVRLGSRTMERMRNSTPTWPTKAIKPNLHHIAVKSRIADRVIAGAGRPSTAMKGRLRSPVDRCRYWLSPFNSAVIGVSVPNSPLASSFGPELKKSALYGPAEPHFGKPEPAGGVLGQPKALFPNMRAHRPSITMGLLFASSMKPTKSPSNPSKTAILPLPKLPIRTRLLKVPKSRGAHTAPQGELSHGPCCRRISRRPPGVNTST